MILAIGINVGVIMINSNHSQFNKTSYSSEIATLRNALSEPILQCYKHIVFFNLESTGIDYNKENILELSVINTSPSNGNINIIKDFSSLIKFSDTCFISDYITKITGITTSALLKGGISKEDAIGKLDESFLLEDALYMSYNTQLDICFINRLYESCGTIGIFNNKDVLDLMTVYKDRSLKPPHRLKDAINTYSLTPKNTHRGLRDAYAIFELFKALIKERDDLRKYVNLFGYSSGDPGSMFPRVTYKKQSSDTGSIDGYLYEK